MKRLFILSFTAIGCSSASSPPPDVGPDPVVEAGFDSGPLEECMDNGDCDDGNVCHTRACNLSMNTCFVESTITCDDGNACTVDACNPSTGCYVADMVCL